MTFPGMEPPPDKPLSLGARRTLNANRRIAQGISPASGLALRETPEGEKPKTCGDCWHAIATQAGNHGYVWKCELGKLSHSEASDIRLKWPACMAFSTTDDGRWEAIGTPGWVRRRGANRR